MDGIYFGSSMQPSKGLYFECVCGQSAVVYVLVEGLTTVGPSLVPLSKARTLH